jgi:ferric-dicitrate binding protein FerR (iron transport regulator)
MNDHGFGDMDQKASRTAYLISGYLAQTLSGEERKELDNWIGESRDNQHLFEELTDPVNIEKYASILQQMDKQKIKEKIDSRIGIRKSAPPVWVYLAAAVTIGVVILAYFIFFKSSSSQNGITFVNTNPILPGSDKAILVRANGDTLDLNNMKRGDSTNENGVTMQKYSDAEIRYEDTIATGSEMYVNTVFTPRGGQYKLVLSDGTKVWLNAASSVSFPTAFNFLSREVSVTGEVYFEVTKGKSWPFIVRTKDADIRVLGTHFNVNSYADENLTRVTLSEGSVEIKSDSLTQVIKPGMQAAIEKGKHIWILPVDTSLYMAWKEGYFRWKDENIASIMRQVSRWYDVDISIENDIKKENFGGIVARKDSISKVLRIMESTSTIHFKTEGKKIIVTK